LHRKNLLLKISLGLFALSLCLPVIEVARGNYFGLFAFTLGWMTSFAQAGIAWWANPFLIAAWLSYRNSATPFRHQKRQILIFSGIALAFSFCTFLFGKLAGTGMCGSGFLESYSCNERIHGYGLGVWCCMGSILTIVWDGIGGEKWFYK